MTRNYKSITLLLVALAVLSFSSALYMYNDYRILDQNYQAMQGNIDEICKESNDILIYIHL